MAGKHYVFSARTTEEGLKILSQLKKDRGIGWDDLVVDAVCAHYSLDKAVIGIPKTEKPKLTEEERKARRNEASKRAREKKNAGKPKVEKAKVEKPKAQQPAKAKTDKPRAGNGNKQAIEKAGTEVTSATAES
jgi:hypothetical protein